MEVSLDQGGHFLSLGFLIWSQKKISSSKVFIVGAGGLGCPVADLLCRAGIGEIGIIDHDKISLSNLNRQTLFNTNDINKYKVDVLKKKLKKINPLVKVNIFNKYIFATENQYLLYPTNYKYHLKNYNNTFQHGGISMEEMIIPFIELSPKNIWYVKFWN